ncbi:sensor histidine kinase [Shewanella sp. 11B5]|jgi:signal transduction histidine kinase|uniref:sensor histidine kinase n=1 Tax=unclassified Shewanella TaxID=196818 RepID=UPI000C7B6A21|nr:MULTISPECIES: HAMP domain-containing sensor histidine kinase [unclassified Shewanella]MBB1380858.1 HAMP domain-containing histidine kinase [Shewanella sp. SR41-2]MBB1425703.1 HAMP domain-containing histidine kinase [Shewanella sp. SG44-2]PKI07133.1 sensor histidine kinase [Shewanella sp. 11B5]|tara:strand:- start:67 stop:1323 length:1257 start_codon:yes stop_codon:yes gene_type:complete
MKLRPSLRIFVLLVMLFTGISTILILSALSVHYYISGMDKVMLATMYAHGQEQVVTDGHPSKSQLFTVASRWQDLPKDIQLHIKLEPSEFNVLHKNIIGGSPLKPPEKGFFVIKVLKGDQIRYVSSILDKKMGNIPPPKDKPFFLVILATAIFSIVMFTLILLLMMRKVTLPIERLKNWAKELDSKQLADPAPDFHYSELNTLANIVKTSLGTVQESLDREQQFLGYASHELRTPIAVIRTNTELLQKLISKGASAEKQAQVVNRIERAGLTMTDLTETLLWLTRREGKSLPLKEVNLGQLIRQLVQDLRYLIHGKNIEISIETDDSAHQLPDTLCRIIITNLIRNALQHTVEGSVTIRQSATSVSIANQCKSYANSFEELGFGLGLELTTRLISQYDWDYQNIDTNRGRKVSIDFSR